MLESWQKLEKINFENCQFWIETSYPTRALQCLKMHANMCTIEELLERKSSSSGPEIRDYGCRGSVALTTQHLSIRKSWH
jgi:hypothetical protein